MEMSQSIAFQRQGVHVRPLSATVALVAVFILGTAGGYAARTATSPATSNGPQQNVVPSPTPKQTILPNQA
jgi:hypothetical protein